MRATTGWIGALLLVTALAAGCAPGGPAGDVTAASPAGDQIRVGAFNFAESRLLAELYAQALRDEGYPVSEVAQLGSREIVEPALQQGRVDVVPEYTGSALAFLDPRRAAVDSDRAQTHAALVEAYGSRGVTVGAAASAQNQNALVVTQQTADRLDLRTITDLGPAAGDLVLGGPPECPQRDACLAGLRDVYGLEFSRFLSVDRTDHVVAALQAGEIDVGVLFTTDPAILIDDFVVLADERGLQPPDNVVPVVRTAVVDRHGEDVTATLDRVSAELTTRELAQLNRSVEGGADVRDVAAAWLEDHDITR